MGHESTVSGYIEARAGWDRRALDAYPFDDAWPFTDIFGEVSPARYGTAVVPFAGVYKQVEEVWGEWLWKFGQMLARLEAGRARVNLECLLGDYTWVLEPGCALATPREHPASYIGQTWYVSRAPAEDFSVDPAWIARVEGNLALEAADGRLAGYRWAKLIGRWPGA